jgi:transglutaminase-like putative cysteine protease
MSGDPTQLARPPYRALRAAVFLMLVESVLLAYPSGSWIVSGLLALLSISRLWTIRSGWCLRLPMFWNSLFLAVVFVVKFTVAPAEYSTDAPFINTELAHEIGCWLLAMQILVLHEPRSLQRIPATVGAMGCLVVICAGDIRLHSLSRGTMLVLMVLFVGGLGWFAHASRDWIRVDQKRRLRRVILAGTLIAACVPTVLAAQAWHQHERDLELLLIRMMKALDGESSESHSGPRSFLSQISNGRIHNPEQIVLKVRQSAPNPAYLRGWCYDNYLASTWSVDRSRQQRPVPAMVPDPILRARVSSESGPWPEDVALFPLHKAVTQQWSTFEVEYFPESEPYPYIPYETAELELPVSEMNLDSRRNLSLTDDAMPSRLVAYVPSQTVDELEPLPDAVVRRVPDTLDARIRKLAAAVLKGSRTDRERIAAVESFFRENFRYQVGLETPRDQDPITHFLLERPPAHCEYFATGAALLLRLGGVPTRYVTGYVPSEFHSGGFWIARRKDGHAWVEAYDREARHWVTVEATPEAGLPDRRDASWSAAWSERWRVWHAELQRKFSELGPLSALGMILQTVPVRIGLSLLFIGAWILISRKYRQTGRVIASEATERPTASLRLSELEQLLSRRGLERKPSETLFQFRDRIATTAPDSLTLQPVVEWYGTYGQIRYDDSGRTVERLRELDEAWMRISRSLEQG